MKTIASLFFVLLTCVSLSHADDVEIYTGNITGVGDPNVIFIFDTSGSMRTDDALDRDGNRASRMEVSKEAAVSIISGLSDVNIGLVRFDNTPDNSLGLNTVYTDSSLRRSTNLDDGGYIQVPVKSVNDDNHKNSLIHAIQGLPANAWTPLLETYDEAARYFRGEDVNYGKKYGPYSCTHEDKLVTVDGYWTEEKQCVEYKMVRDCLRWGWWGCRSWSDYYEDKNQCERYEYSDPEYIEGYEYTETVQSCNSSRSYQDIYMSHPDTYDKSSGKYVSPIQDTCQSNHIIVFTDGASSYDSSSDTRIRDFVRTLGSTESYISLNCSTSPSRDQSFGDSCLEELALALKNIDAIEDSRLPNDDNPGEETKQEIFTYTIGGFFDDSNPANKRLKDMAAAGGGIYTKVEGANAYNEIQQALINTFQEIQTKSSNFSSPSVAVNALNRLENSEELYYTVFAPNNSIGWEGNLKRYRLGSDGKIYDANNRAAVNTATGFFDKDSTSIWTLQEDAPDGDVVPKGGAARRMTTNRNVITHLGGNNSLIRDRLIKADLTPNTTITQTLLGVDGIADDEYTDLLYWGAGLNNTDAGLVPRRAIEDPLHSEPAIIHYGIKSDGKTLDSTVFFGTNSGYLHAIDSDTNNPLERFAYIPKELLPNLSQYKNNPDTLGKVYGLDGPISTWLNESGDNDTRFIIDSDDKAYMYIGMRRGGSSYYALDVSDRDNPQYMWQINGGAGDFAELGQTWSEMTPIDINPKALGISSTETSIKALVFGGGYDTVEDNRNSLTDTRIPHTVGNAIFIVDALTGKLLWKASNTSAADLKIATMTSSIVSKIIPVDNDGNGNIDILYAADVGGRLWRIDLLDDGSQFATMLADFNDGTTVGNTRFYTSPDVSYITENGKNGRYVVAIGSGYRAHPLNTISQDKYFVLFDYLINENQDELKAELSSYNARTQSDLANYDAYATEPDSRKKNGMYFELPETGEKVLSDSITVDASIYFTTYKPTVSTSASLSCTGSSGNARLYTVDLNFAKRSLQKDPGSGSQPPEDIVVNFTELSQSTIPSSPVLVFPPSSGGSNGGGSGSGGDGGSDCEGQKTILVGSESLSTGDCPTMNRHYWHEV